METNRHLQPKSGAGIQAQNLWDKGKGQLMLAERIRLNTNKLVAVYVSKSALLNVWWPVTLKERKNLTREQIENIQVLWLNSTFGLMCILSLRQDTEGPWIGLKKETWGNVPLLDISKLKQNQIQALAELYSTLCGQEASAIPIQINQAVQKEGWRYELDQKLTDIVVGEPKDLTPIYEMLTKEPIISLKPLGN